MVDGKKSQMDLTHYKDDCNGTAEPADPYDIPYSTSGISELIMVATEKDFTTWTRGSKKSNKINVFYTIKTPEIANGSNTIPAVGSLVWLCTNSKHRFDCIGPILNLLSLPKYRHTNRTILS